MPPIPSSNSKRQSTINGAVGVITGSNNIADSNTEVEGTYSETVDGNSTTISQSSSPSLSSPELSSDSPSTLCSESEEQINKIENLLPNPGNSELETKARRNPCNVSSISDNSITSVATFTSSTLATTTITNQTVRIVSGTSIESPIIIDEETLSKSSSHNTLDEMHPDSNNSNYNSLSEAEIPPGDYGRMPPSHGNGNGNGIIYKTTQTISPSSPPRTVLSPRRPTTGGANDSLSNPRIIRSNAQKNLNNWSFSSLSPPSLNQHQPSIDAVFDNNMNIYNNHNNNHKHHQHPQSIAAAAAIASLEEEKARKLRDEIAQGSVELQQLQSLLAHLPRLKRSTTRTTTSSSTSLNSTISHSNSSNSNINASGFIGGRSHSILGTSQVITDLQSTIDILKRQLSEQEQIANDERDGKEALKKRCDLVESTLDSLRHQNANLTQLLSRRERRISELEHDIECKAREVSLLRQSETNALSKHVDYQERILRLQEERDRLGAGYNTVLESSKRIKSKYQEDISDIMSKVLVLQEQRQGDVAKIASLEVRLRDQSIDHDRLLQLQEEMAQIRQQHVGTIDKLCLDMKRTMSLSDHLIISKVDSIQAIIDLVDSSNNGSKKALTTTTTSTSFDRTDKLIQANIT